jgi:molybdopterin molybdotransferase
MTTLEQALLKLSSIPKETRITEVDINDTLGLVLAQNVHSDVDMPPFDKSAMDGYACRQSDLAEPLIVIESIYAGVLPQKVICKGECAKIMTGAKIPEGADCVIIVEHTKEQEDGRIVFTGKETKSNICFKGEDVKNNEKVLVQGSIINPASIAVAASVGKTTLSVFEPPKIALITTGDELIEINEKIEGAKIRNSNAYNLIAQINKTPATVNYLGIVLDSKQELEEAIVSALKYHDILIITGGVSMGDKDYVPEIFRELGLELVYENIAIQPGKPTAFAHGKGKFCFGLSGNPVSSLLQFELLAKSFIYYFMKHTYKLPLVKMKLTIEKRRKKAERKQFFPIQLIEGNAHSLEFHGSAHIAGLVNADGFGIFEIGKNNIEANEEIDVLLI